jgi:hypothetical protein
VKPGALSVHEGDTEPVLQTMIQPWPIEPAPAFTVPELGTGGLQDGKFSGRPCVLFADVHGSNAGTNGTRTGEPLIGFS